MTAGKANKSNSTDLHMVSDQPIGANASVCLGTLVGLDSDGNGVVDLSKDGGDQVVATPIQTLDLSHVGQRVVVAKTESAPIILGVLNNQIEPASTSSPLQVELDGETLHLRADRQVTISVGDASITLNQDGKVTVKGAEVLIRARGANKIRGGNVQIN